MSFVYSVWVGNEVFRDFDSLDSVMKFANYVADRETVSMEIEHCCVAWVEHSNRNSDVQNAEKEGWVRTNVTIVKETEDEMHVVSRFCAFLLPRPKWYCGYDEIVKVGI